MKKKYLAYIAIAALTLTVGGVASAHGWFGGLRGATPEEIASRHTTMFQQQANLFGVSVDEAKNAWAQGKTLWDLAQEKGISQEQLQQKMKDAKLAQLKSQLQTLVEKGVITQAQADQRLQFMQSRTAQGMGKMGRGFHRGMMGMWF